MFILFWNLYLAMFKGTWNNYTFDQFILWNKSALNTLGTFLTSIFSGVTEPYTTLGNLVDSVNGTPAYLYLLATVLATITSIGIVVMAVKGVKKAFGIFFMGIR